MARTDYTDYDEEIPRNRQDQRGDRHQNNNQQRNKNQQQQGNRDKPDFRPPSPIRAAEKDHLYQMIFRFAPANTPGEDFLIPSSTYFIQGRGVVDGRFGLRRSNTKGFAIYDSDGTLFFIHENDPEYTYFRERVDDWNNIWDNLVKLADTAPAAQRRNRRAASTKNSSPMKQFVLSWYVKWGLILLFLATLIFVLTRG